MDSDSQKHLIDQLQQLTSRLSQANFHPCLTEAEIQEFENMYRVSLPMAYRLFLLHLGNGGLGIEALSLPSSESNLFHSSLQRDFPYLYESHILNFEQFVGWYKTNPKAVEQFVDVSNFRKNYHASHQTEIENQLTLFNIKTFFEGEDFLEDLYEAYLYSPHHTDGTIYLGNFDPDIGSYLVIRGKRKGTIWGRGVAKIFPLQENGKYLDFLSWIDEMF